MLERLDQSLFLFVNSHFSPFWDKIMWTISAKPTWIPLYLFMLIIIGIKYKWKMLVIVPIIILTITASDQLSVHAFKEVFQRLRPCHEPSLFGMVHMVNEHCGGKYGFVSSHAANTFAGALLTLLMVRRRWFTIMVLAWAAIVSYSRVYLGVHYPGDVICGGLLGALLGYLFYLLYKFIDKRILSETRFFKT